MIRGFAKAGLANQKDRVIAKKANKILFKELGPTADFFNSKPPFATTSLTPDSLARFLRSLELSEISEITVS
jgi:hypothetical protein